MARKYINLQMGHELNNTYIYNMIINNIYKSKKIKIKIQNIKRKKYLIYIIIFSRISLKN